VVVEKLGHQGGQAMVVGSSSVCRPKVTKRGDNPTFWRETKEKKG